MPKTCYHHFQSKMLAKESFLDEKYFSVELKIVFHDQNFASLVHVSLMHSRAIDKHPTASADCLQCIWKLQRTSSSDSQKRVSFFMLNSKVSSIPR